MANLLNVEIPDLAPGYTPLELVTVVKCLDEQGNLAVTVRSSDGLMAWEAVGMLIAATDMMRRDMEADLITDDTYDDQQDDEPQEEK